MNRKQDKASKRKAKQKAKRVHEEQLRHQLSNQIASAIIDLCEDVLPEYVDDSQGIDLVGRNILWRMGMVAWNIAVTGRREVEESFVNAMKLDEESREMVREEVNGLIRRKYEKYPELRTAIKDVSALLVAGEARLKVSLGDTFPAMPIPDFDDRPNVLTPEEILAKRKGLGMTQVKFAAAIGVSAKKISAGEHGKIAPTPAELVKIGKILPA